MSVPEISEAPRPSSVEEYRALDRIMGSYSQRSKSLWKENMRWLARNDLFYLTTRIGTTRGLVNKASGRPLFEREFILARCRDIEAAEHNVPDVWGRGMGKSTLKTKYRSIQLALNDANSATCIFSYQRNAALAHLRGIRDELALNRLLKKLFEDILFWEPGAGPKGGGSPTWSLKDGLVIKRTSSRTEATFEAHVLSRLPTGRHYDRLVWDDIEDEQAVSSPEQLEKLHRTFGQSANLKSLSGGEPVRSITGTFYHSGGIMATQVRKYRDQARVYPGEDLEEPGDGPMGGTPLYYSVDELQQWYDDINDPVIYGMQICCDYRAGSHRTLNPDHLITFPGDPLDFGRGCYAYVCVDPSLGRGDPACIWVWGTTSDRRFAWLDVVLQRLTPLERMEEIYRVAMKWQQISLGVMEIRIEEFAQADYCRPQEDYNARMGIGIPVTKCCDPTASKIERIYHRWQPVLAAGRILVPERLMVSDTGGTLFDAVDYFKTFELGEMPKPATDNMLDAGSLAWEPAKKSGSLKIPDLVFPPPLFEHGVDDIEPHSARTYMSAGIL